jgi:hypothetical protein
MQPTAQTPISESDAPEVQSAATPAATTPAKPRARWVTVTGISFIALSVVFFGLFFVVPFLPLSLGVRGVLLLVCWIGSESTFALGGVLLGMQIVRRYRRFLKPANWFRRAPKSVASAEMTSAE